MALIDAFKFFSLSLDLISFVFLLLEHRNTPVFFASVFHRLTDADGLLLFLASFRLLRNGGNSWLCDLCGTERREIIVARYIDDIA
mmetsp:Transcript_4008/g.5313  ORF Transcript_4008/g.5313 Transcript_4008/m.5313 type:complete len:86 (+) Transcript_4008:362-619(+)